MSIPIQPYQDLFFTEPPAFIGELWLTYGQGLSYIDEPPLDLCNPENLKHSNLWLRLLYVFEQAKLGNFANVGSLLEIANMSENGRLRDSAIRIFGHVASSDLRNHLEMLFLHTDLETRLEAYEAAANSADLDLIDGLLAARGRSISNERERVMDMLSNLLEYEPSERIIDDAGRLPDDQYDAMIRNGL